MRFLRLLTCVLLLLVISSAPSLAQMNTIQPTYFKANVTNVDTEVLDTQTIQKLTIEITEGDEKGKTLSLTQTFPSTQSEKNIKNGETLVISKTISQGKTHYTIYDRYRLPPLFIIVGAFFLLVVLAAGRKGLGAIIGLSISFAVLILYIVPQILHGSDPLFVTISGSLLIMIVTIYLAHGFSQRTTVAIGGTFLSLVITGLLATGMVQILGLTGLGSEEAYMLQFQGITINLKGLLLGGIIIGTLGVLDDITTAQAATVYELAHANEKFDVKELFKRGYSVGKEHITSLVNTLVLAYAGASLPIFIFFVVNPLNQPWWLILNSEMIIEEIVRTLAGSIGLILAVPITTILAAFFSRYRVKIS